MKKSGWSLRLKFRKCEEIVINKRFYALTVRFMEEFVLTSIDMWILVINRCRIKIKFSENSKLKLTWKIHKVHLIKERYLDTPVATNSIN